MQDFALPMPGEPAPQNASKRRQSLAVRLGKRLRDPVNGWLARQSLIGDDVFIDPAVLPGLAELRWHSALIRDELAPLLERRAGIPPLGEISPDHRRIATGSHWKSFFLMGYGYRSDENCAQCPQTAALLERVPGLIVAFFSIMEPGTQVPLHRGLTKAWINCHLGLVVPQGSGGCAIEVAGTTTGWREGEWLAFDETYVHRVWNETSEPRVVLFLQVLRPMRLPGRLAAWVIQAGIRRTSFVQDVRRKLRAR